jgi:hypothetical protein
LIFFKRASALFFYGKTELRFWRCKAPNRMSSNGELLFEN